MEFFKLVEFFLENGLEMAGHLVDTFGKETMPSLLVSQDRAVSQYRYTQTMTEFFELVELVADWSRVL